MKIYIAGKITGLVYEDALRAFAEAAAEVERCGHVPVNPMAVNGLDGDGQPHAWAEYMKRDIPHLLACDAIYLLPNWKDSKGARLEKHIAEELGMMIVTHGFAGKRGEIFPVCKDCGNVLDEDAGVYHCGECKRKVEELTARYQRLTEQCGKCGARLDDNAAYIGAEVCNRCLNSISSISGVGIQSAARV